MSCLRFSCKRVSQAVRDKGVAENACFLMFYQHVPLTHLSHTHTHTQPHRCMWPWHARTDVKNDFFQLSTPECLALGSMGRFALYIDQELLQVRHSHL